VFVEPDPIPEEVLVVKKKRGRKPKEKIKQPKQPSAYA
jgi:hypothetical protein